MLRQNEDLPLWHLLDDVLNRQHYWFLSDASQNSSHYCAGPSGDTQFGSGYGMGTGNGWGYLAGDSDLLSLGGEGDEHGYGDSADCPNDGSAVAYEW